MTYLAANQYNKNTAVNNSFFFWIAIASHILIVNSCKGWDVKHG